LQQGLFTRDTIESLDAEFLIGLPALVILRAVIRSFDLMIDDGMTVHLADDSYQPIGGIKLLDGTIVTNINRPSDPFSRYVYIKLIELKQQMISANLSDYEIKFMEKWISTGGDIKKCPTPITMGEDRRIEIMRIASILTNICIKASLTPTFKNKFVFVKNKLLTGIYDSVV
jgi:hypothetical protein